MPVRRLSVLIGASMAAQCFSLTAAADEAKLCEATHAEVADLMTKTEMGMMPDYDGTVADYKSDGNPNSIEIVILGKKGEKAQVSDDGEVIFVTKKTKDKEQQDLMIQAFARKLMMQKASATGCKLPF